MGPPKDSLYQVLLDVFIRSGKQNLAVLACTTAISEIMALRQSL